MGLVLARRLPTSGTRGKAMSLPTKKRFLLRFVVSGHGAFPMEMLRDDRCFPDTEEDVNKLTRCELRTVSLCSHVSTKGDYPAAHKWREKGWRVMPSVKHYKL